MFVSEVLRCLLATTSEKLDNNSAGRWQNKLFLSLCLSLYQLISISMEKSYGENILKPYREKLKRKFELLKIYQTGLSIFSSSSLSQLVQSYKKSLRRKSAKIGVLLLRQKRVKFKILQIHSQNHSRQVIALFRTGALEHQTF